MFHGFLFLTGEDTTYLSYDTPESFDGTSLAHHEAFSNLVTNKITPSGLSPHALNFKVGSIVMLLRNISISSGFCNGTGHN